MLAFFFSSSKIGKHTNETPANRDWKQVCCNSLIGTLFGVLYHYTLQTFDPLPFLSSPYSSTFYLGGFLSFYACATADTWASEIGILSSTPPRLITNPWRIVPKGTNGGVTLLGLAASLCGGLFIGFVFYFSSCVTLQQVRDSYGDDASDDVMPTSHGMRESHASQYWMIVIGTICGLMGSLLDSLLGATLQFSGISMTQRNVIVEDPNIDKDIKHISGRFILSNNAVNMISTMITCFVGGCVSVWIFC